MGRPLERLRNFGWHGGMSEDAEARELRLRAEAAEEADRFKTALLRMVSHDLITPLAVVKVSVASLGQKLDSLAVSLPEGANELLTEIETQTDRLTALVSDLLDLSRLEAGAWQPQRESHDLADLLGATFARFTDQELACIQVMLADDLPALMVDGVQIVQVLWNLLANALKYSPPGAQIEVCAIFEPSGFAFITVTNQGQGIPEGDQERIFEPFYRGKHTTQGSGLGLAICRSLVDAHGGHVWASPSTPSGTRFYLTLPTQVTQ